jgi:cytochrome c biogenesis protein CcmG, thiol:disulfide interchange protein DsbE
MQSKLIYLPLLLFVAIVGALFWQLKRNAEGKLPTSLESALVGNPLPELKLPALDKPNEYYDKQRLNLGHPYLINVWATWCPTCQAEHQYLNNLSRQGVTIVGINYKDSRQAALTWLNQLGNPYTLNLFDGDGMAGLDLGVYGAPETFLVDGQGIIRYRHAGALDADIWQQEIIPLWRQYRVQAK